MVWNPQLARASSNSFCYQTAAYLFQKVIDYARKDVDLTFKLHRYLQQYQCLAYFDTQLKQKQVIDFRSPSPTEHQTLTARKPTIKMRAADAVNW